MTHTAATLGRPVRPGHFHLFVYGTLRRGGASHALLDGCERVANGTVTGTLYDIDGAYPALMLYGTTTVAGEIWRCPDSLLRRLDDFEGTADGLFRRVAVTAGGYACWTYVAGPLLSRRLTPGRRVADGAWRAAAAPARRG